MKRKKNVELRQEERSKGVEGRRTVKSMVMVTGLWWKCHEFVPSQNSQACKVGIASPLFCLCSACSMVSYAWAPQCHIDSMLYFHVSGRADAMYFMISHYSWTIRNTQRIIHCKDRMPAHHVEGSPSELSFNPLVKSVCLVSVESFTSCNGFIYPFVIVIVVISVPLPIWLHCCSHSGQLPHNKT